MLAIILKILFILFVVIDFIYCGTQRMVMDSCYTVPFKGYGFRLTGGSIKGKVNCTNYFEPPDNKFYFSMRVNSLNLKPVGNSCPTFDVIGYTTMRIRPESDLRNKGWEVLEPSDPTFLKRFNCKNVLDDQYYRKGIVFDSTSPGQNLLIQYNADGMNPVQQPFDITISSYYKGESWTCPKEYFRCWEVKYKCLDVELQCDVEDNCYDNSDEYGYTCTGRIGGMKLPVFLIMLLGIVLVLATGIVVLVGCLIQRHKRNKKMPKDEWGTRKQEVPLQYMQSSMHG